MSSAQQRFCPLCDRSFTEGEAILRCQGCGVMHHPACWVKNDGCATSEPHASAPLAQAYTAGRPLMPADHHPAEGTRVIQSRGAPENPAPAYDPREAVTVVDAPRAAPQRVAGPQPPGGPVIGGEEAAEGEQARRRAPAPYMVAGPGKGKAPEVDAKDGRGLPRVYGGRGILGLWYIPAAVLVAVAVAAGVIFAAEAFFGGDDEGASVTTPTPTGAASATGTTAAAASATGAATTPAASPASATATSSAAAPATGGKFAIGDTVVVKGSGDCLNVRKGAGRENEALTCLPDGEELRVTGGPQVSGGLTWWQLRTGAGDGWAAEDYLVKK